jgi:hypothetical protein
VCEKYLPNTSLTPPAAPAFPSPSMNTLSIKTPVFVACTQGHVTHVFLQCDWRSAYGQRRDQLPACSGAGGAPVLYKETVRCFRRTREACRRCYGYTTA